ncbi:hypothetical protein TSOC_000219 [Tetrabaena socialis]|uniref:Plastid lipid-associated protein/fibrillin conserved domain-containing protein n=1 Tax=Tetrabaena socialis TaxID=47790 RepID=A0A2J8AK12_9CHLO|nr:hypothetical protein TSOC_000219 [Tetrabaena socialis]|eukprot:PNH12857.1 hypothetical protein TSOC_000219 [Tetrabaena socialis]
MRLSCGQNQRLLTAPSLRATPRPRLVAAPSTDPSGAEALTNGTGAALYSAAPTTGRGKVLKLLGEGCDTYNGESFEPAVKQLIAENPTAQPGSESVALGQGTWQVFYAPHIARMSSALGTKFDPIQYRLSGSMLVSNVRFSNSVIGDGWLSAGGSMCRKYDDSVEITFDRFWVDVGGDSLRADLPAGAASSILTADGLVGAIG